MRMTGPESTPVVKAILWINVGVFLLWWWLGPRSSLAAENLVVSWDLLAEGRIWVIVTSVFSHSLTVHLLVNMIVLLSFGGPMERLMGHAAFLRFYLLAGVVASLSHAVTSNLLLGRPDLSALGASGALAGVLMLFSFSFPRAKVLFFFVLPLPAVVAALAFIAIDLWGLWAQMGGGTLPIGHGAHLGGGLVGILYAALRGRALKQRAAGAALGPR